MRLITLALELAKIEVTRGIAVRTEAGITISNPVGKALRLPMQTVKVVIDDSTTLDAVTKMSIGAEVPMSVFHLACKRIVDEYYTPGGKQRVMNTRLVVHDRKLTHSVPCVNTRVADVILKRRAYEALHRPNSNG